MNLNESVNQIVTKLWSCFLQNNVLKWESWAFHSPKKIVTIKSPSSGPIHHHHLELTHYGCHEDASELPHEQFLPIL